MPVAGVEAEGKRLVVEQVEPEGVVLVEMGLQELLELLIPAGVEAEVVKQHLHLPHKMVAQAVQV
jgi:hypothetical protein